MGCVNDKAYGGSKQEQVASHKIDVLLRKERQVQESEVKLLLLGAGEAGKTTITKQLKIIHMNGYTQEELASWKDTVISNLFICMHSLVSGATKIGVADHILPQNAEKAEMFKSNEYQVKRTVDQGVLEAIVELWKDPGIQEAYARQSEFQLYDSAAYFFEHVQRIASDNFVPNENDILRCRVVTSGIKEISFYHGGVRWRIVDVGGQRNERKKWIHCFQDVTALIFCVAMSEYDKKLVEDELVNRMHESLALFDEICNCQWFYDTNVLLFLNKSDLFKEKIQKVDLKVCFENYTGGCNYEEAVKFLKKKFTSLNPNRQKPIYVHVTCATDTGNIRFVFNAVKDIVVNQNLLL